MTGIWAKCTPDSAPMMVVLIITRAIGCKPVCPFHRWPEHTQDSVMCSDDRAFYYRVGRDQAMKQSIWNSRAAVERD